MVRKTGFNHRYIIEVDICGFNQPCLFQNENETSEDDDDSSESGDEKVPKEKVPKVKVPKEKVPNNEESDGEDPVTENSDLEVPMMEYYKIRHQVFWSQIEIFLTLPC